MSNQWVTVKVFVSSTFRDMGAERDILAKRAFPALRERLAPYHVDVIDIDLRWGITEELAETVGASELCLKTIKECDLFVSLLGEVYGSVLEGAEVEQSSKHQQGRSITEVEIVSGALEDTGKRRKCFFYFRDPQVVDQIPSPIRERRYVEPDQQKRKQLVDLKRRIRASGIEPFEYSASWNQEKQDSYSLSSGSLDQWNSLVENVVTDLFDAIRRALNLSDAADAKVRSAAGDDTFKHRSFATTTPHFVSRDDVITSLVGYVNGADKKALALLGPSGSGKTAVLASLVEESDELFPDMHVVAHFVGATAASYSLSDALGRFCHAIKRIANVETAIPNRLEARVRVFAQLLEETRPQARVLLILDGITEMDAECAAHELKWLPPKLPANVRVICSGRTAMSAVDAAQDVGMLIDHRSPAEDYRDIESAANKTGCVTFAMPPLTADESKALVEQATNLRAKSLDQNQKQHLLAMDMSVNPLFLTVLLEELRLFGSFNHLDRFISTLPSPDPADHYDADWAIMPIFNRLVNRLIAESSDRSDRVLLLLALTKSGLSETELANLSGAERESVAVILRQLRPYLNVRDGLCSIRFDGLRIAITLGREEKGDLAAAREDLIGYLRTLPNGERKARDLYHHAFERWSCDDGRSMLEFMLQDLELLKTAWDIDREKVLDYARASVSFSMGLDLRKLMQSDAIAIRAFKEVQERASAEFEQGRFAEVARLYGLAEVASIITRSGRLTALARTNMMVAYAKQGNANAIMPVYREHKASCLDTDVRDQFIKSLTSITVCCIEERHLAVAVQLAAELQEFVDSPLVAETFRGMITTTPDIEAIASQLRHTATGQSEHRSPNAYFAAAVAASRAGDREAALDCVLAGLKLDFMTMDARRMVQGVRSASVVAVESGALEKVLTAIESCISAIDEDTLQTFRQLEVLLKCVEIVISMIDQDREDSAAGVRAALAEMEQTLAERHDGFLLPVLWCGQAQFEQRIGEHDRAIEIFRSARAGCARMSNSSSQQYVCLMEAKFFRALGRDEDAIRSSERVITLSADESEASLAKSALAIRHELAGADQLILIGGPSVAAAGQPVSFLVTDTLGLAVIAGARIVKAMSRLERGVKASYRGETIDAKSILSLSMLAVASGSTLQFEFEEDVDLMQLGIPTEVGVFLPEDCRTTANCRACQAELAVALDDFRSVVRCQNCGTFNRMGKIAYDLMNGEVESQ